MLRLGDFLRVGEAAAYLGVAPNTIRNWGQRGKIPEYRHPVNNYRLYRRDDLRKFMQRVDKPRLAGRPK